MFAASLDEAANQKGAHRILSASVCALVTQERRIAPTIRRSMENIGLYLQKYQTISNCGIR